MRKIFNAHNFYIFGLVLKAINGFFEIISSILILAVDVNKWPSIISYIFRKELIEDPNDFILNLFLNTLQKFDIGIQFFIFLYLLSHGMVKLFLVGSLVKKKYWAYPLSEIILILFVLYQSYLFINSRSMFILFLNCIDIALAALIWIEYKKTKDTLIKT